MRTLSAEHGFKRTSDRAQANNIGTGAIEGEKYFRLTTENVFERRDGSLGVGIVTVRRRISVIGLVDRLDNFRVCAGTVIAGEIESLRQSLA